MKKKVFKNLGLSGVALCVLCCALPIIGAALGIGSLVALSMYLEMVAIAILGISAILLIYYNQKGKEKKVCETSCETDCSCNAEEAKPS